MTTSRQTPMRTYARVGWPVVAGVVTLIVAGCAQPGSPVGAPAPSPAVDDPDLVDDGYDGRFRTSGAVLESPAHGPQLCFEQQDSYPPQCSGPDIVGWDWAAVEAESASGTRWGSYEITGTWDGATFTLTEPAGPATGSSYSSYPRHDYDFSAPCPEPAGGWPPVPRELADDPMAWEAGKAALGNLPDLSASWVDQGGTPADPEPVPGRYVMVLRTTGDVAAMEAAAREVWSGRVCVIGGGRYTEAEARDIEDALRALPDVLAGTVHTDTEEAEVTVYVATEQRQRELDDRYGVGVVAQVALFEPLDGEQD